MRGGALTCTAFPTGTMIHLYTETFHDTFLPPFAAPEILRVPIPLSRPPPPLPLPRWFAFSLSAAEIFPRLARVLRRRPKPNIQSYRKRISTFWQ